MGSRANYVIVDPSAEGGFDLFYSHWAASTIDRDLFWGPEQALRFVRAQQAVPHEDWLNSTWSDGGALIDPGRRVLMLYGADDRMLDLGRRRVYLQLLAEVWTDWAVHWAHGGAADLADYVGVSREHVLVRPRADDLVEPFAIRDGRFRTALSVRWRDGAVDHWQTPRRLADLLALGSEFVEQLKPHRPAATAVAEDWDSAPAAGVHIDVGLGTISVWSLTDGGLIDWLLQERWGPWQSEYVGDLPERQTELTDGAVRVPLSDTARNLDSLTDWLSSRRHVSGVDTLEQVLQADGKDNRSINPWALRDDHVPPDEAARDAVLATAIRAVQG